MTVQATSTPGTCRHCGASVSAGDRFCVQCGTRIERAAAPLPVKTASRRPLIVGLAILVLLAGGIVVWLGVGRSGAEAAAWMFSDNEDGTQVLFARDGQAPLFRIVCNREDGVIAFNSQALAGDAVEERASARHRLDATLSGGGSRLELEGYVATAPEGASVAWETPYGAELLKILSAPDFAVAGPSLSLKSGAAPALAQFVAACPPPAAAAPEPLGWGTVTSVANGYRLDIPRKIFRIVRGDRFGRGYEAETGNATLAVLAQVNAMQQGLEQAMKEGVAGLPDLERETYRRVTRDSAVVSGTVGGAIVYYKARATCGGANIAYFVLTYESQARATFDPIVTRMAKSFDATALAAGRPICP
jgi:hypothetical protein